MTTVTAIGLPFPALPGMSLVNSKPWTPMPPMQQEMQPSAKGPQPLPVIPMSARQLISATLCPKSGAMITASGSHESRPRRSSPTVHVVPTQTLKLPTAATAVVGVRGGRPMQCSTLQRALQTVQEFDMFISRMIQQHLSEREAIDQELETLCWLERHSLPPTGNDNFAGPQTLAFGSSTHENGR